MPVASRLLLACGMLLLAARAEAAVNCSATTIGELNFGTINIIPGSAITASTSVDVSCSFTGLDALGLTTVRMCLSIGNGSGGRDATSRIFEGSPALRYQLFTEGTYTTTWGDRFQSFPTVPAVTLDPNTPSAQFSLYGQILPNQQTIPPGDYVSHFTTSHVNFRYGLNVLGIIACDAFNLSLLNLTVSPTFDVKAKVDKNCSLSTSSVDFVSHGVLASTITDEGALTLRCTSGTEYFVGLDNGENGSDPEARQMKHLSLNEYVTYGLYKTSGTGDPWGNSGALRKSGTGNGNFQSIDVFGRVPPQATPPPGTYRDHVVVTVTY